MIVICYALDMIRDDYRRIGKGTFSRAQRSAWAYQTRSAMT